MVVLDTLRRSERTAMVKKFLSIWLAGLSVRRLIDRKGCTEDEQGRSEAEQEEFLTFTQDDFVH
jgi:hypothetical protein